MHPFVFTRVLRCGSEKRRDIVSEKWLRTFCFCSHCKKMFTKMFSFFFIHISSFYSYYLSYFAILPSFSICTLWGTNYSGSSKFLESAFKLKKNSPSCANVIHKTLSLAIARCFLTEGGKKVYKIQTL